MTATWSIAVFAHDEADRIAATLRSIVVAAQGVPVDVVVDVVVLANGCRDRTVEIVRELALQSNHLRVVEIALGDKANAWNHYVHNIAATAPAEVVAMHVFVDGDIRVEPGSFAALAAAFHQVPSANAVGALPTSGRDREAWSRRMIASGTLAGGLYALRGDFVERIRQRKIRIPQGLIGEDWLVSLFASSDLNPVALSLASAPRVAFAPDAGFSFRSLSPWHPADYRTYLRRLWRYALRAVQYEMAFGWLLLRAPETLPPEVEQLYLLTLPPSRLKWIGPTSLLRFFAVQKVRGVRSKRAQNNG